MRNEIKTLTGHLTQTDKRNIRAIMGQGLAEGKINGKTYFITRENEIYTVKKYHRDRGLIPCPGSQLRTSEYISTFMIQ